MAISKTTDNKPVRRIAIFGIGVIGASWTPVCTENLNPTIMVMKSAKDGA
jgi:hypothetical protein